jgi:uncharacterized surface protein with fasciclin (FAS1) repeats
MVSSSNKLFLLVVGVVLATSAVGCDAKTVYQTAKESEALSTLVAAIDAAGFKKTLNNPNFRGTVLAPTNEAFGILLDNLGLTAEELLGNTDLLKSVLRYHIIPDDKLTTQSLEQLQSWGTDLDDSQVLDIYKSEKGTVRIYYGGVTPGRQSLKYPGSAKIIPGLRNIKADDAIVQVIDRVLVPKL